MKRQRAEHEGRTAEDSAMAWLEQRGWRILDRRRKTPLGEIDIIARDGDVIVFVEVKWRRLAQDLDHAIDAYRLRRVVAAANAVAHEYAEPQQDLRIDVLLLAPGQEPRHIVNAGMA